MKSKIVKMANKLKAFLAYQASQKIISAIALLITSGGLIYYQWVILPKHKIFQEAPVTSKAVVIGSGVGGLTSAIYLSQLGIDTILITGKDKGGALATTGWVENWPGDEKIMGQELVQRLTQHAVSSGAQFIQGEVLKVDFKHFPYSLTIDNGKNTSTIKTYGVIIATGATPKKLQIPGEELYWGKGVTTCAICDGPLQKGKDVAVIGGGDSAMTEAQILAPLAKTVYILIRKESRAKQNLLESVNSLANVKILYHTKPLEIIGNGKNVTGIKIDNKGQIKELEVSGVFLAIGSTPNTQVFKDSLKLTSQELLKTDAKCKCSQEGVFAIGDVSNADHRQAVVAAGQGCIAALECISFLNKHELNRSKYVKSQKPKSQVWSPSSKSKKELSEKKEQKTEQSSGIIEAKSLEQVEQEIENSSLPVLVDFYATWCPPCKAMSPVIDQLAKELDQKAIFIKVNIDKAPEASQRYQVQGVPTFIVVKEGKEVKRFVGYTPGEHLSKALLDK